MRRLLPLLSLLFAAAPALSAPPVRPEFSTGGPTCFLNKAAAQRNAARLSGGVIPFGPPSPSAPKVLVIRVDFSDVPMQRSETETESFFDDVRAYYLENSYGVFRPTFTVSSTIHHLGAVATYGADCSADVACNDAKLRNDAITAEGPFTVFGLYDQIMVYHAGNGQESTGRTDDIWSVYVPDSFVAGAQTFPGFTIVPEKEASGVDALGVICHEYGHQQGLPDLYDVSRAGGQSTVGAWDLMDYPYTAAPGGALGSNPPHLGAWDKLFLGFVAPQVVNASLTATLAETEVSSTSVLRIPIVGGASGPANEYFLVENRTRNNDATYDHGIPGSGLLVWRIDDTIASNTTDLNNNDVNTPSLNGRGHRGVELIEADGIEQPMTASHGKPSDAITDKGAILPPLTDAPNGAPSGVVVIAQSGAGTESAVVRAERTQPSSGTISTAGFSRTVAAPFGSVGMTVAPGAFASGTVVEVATVSASAFAALDTASNAGTFSGTGLGWIASATGGADPESPVHVSMDISSDASWSSATSAEREKMTLLRFVPVSHVWVPVPTTSDGSTTIAADVAPLSLYQLAVGAPVGGPSSVHIFPNPLRPALGPSYAVMNFTDVPSDARIRLFTVTGEPVRELRANGAGIAVWDGTDVGGSAVGSAVYLAVIEDANGGGRVVKKLVVER